MMAARMHKIAAALAVALLVAAVVAGSFWTQVRNEQQQPVEPQAGVAEPESAPPAARAPGAIVEIPVVVVRPAGASGN